MQNKRSWRAAAHKPSGHVRYAYPFSLALIMIAGLLLGGCSQDPQWQLKDISRLVHSLQFHLTNDQGQTVDAAHYRGDIVLLYFGFTHCPDVCPLTLAKLAHAVDKLKPSVAKRVKILFVTVDPKRDSLSQLTSYTNAFGPEFVGLRGTRSQLDSVTKRYRVTYSYGKPNANGDYNVTHSSSVFIFDGSGNARLLATFKTKAPAIIHDLKQLAGQRD